MPSIAYPVLSNTVPQGYSPPRLVPVTLLHESPLSAATRTLTMPGASRWAFSAEYRNLLEADAAVMHGWLTELEGMGGRFTCWPLHRQWPRGTCRAVSATASAASALATTITAAGLGAGATVLIGDFFSIGNYLYCCTAGMTADGSGNGTIPFKPGLRAAHSNGAAITFYRPSSTFRLLSDDVSIDLMPGRLANVTIDAIEAFL